MAHWYTVYHDEDYEAEIQVGLYDHWLRQLGFGPTQADRVLFHTPMMEHADERRFAACQAGIDMSSFEADHSRRIKQTLDHVHLRINTYTSTETCEVEDHRDEGLIGLVQCPTQDQPSDCSQFPVYLGVPHTASVQNDLSFMLGEAQLKTTKRAHTSYDDISADNTDDEDYLTYQARIYDNLVTTRKKARTMTSAGALQLKPARCRREPSSITKNPGKQRSRADLRSSNSA